ncbi:hypothetical protein OHB14_49600 [Streptomyces sp. NBC_01613]|uniref:SAV_915 family protein n=1 Tax=Streptomyces sp. NBC_01613 TaxID=2975896 RepID=UPI00386E99C0
MTDILSGEDPEPADRLPAGPLFVPVRPGPSGCAARLFRTPLGERTAVAFTSVRTLTSTLGPDQAWIRLAEPALRALTASGRVTARPLPGGAPPPSSDALSAPGQPRTVRFVMFVDGIECFDSQSEG